MNATRYVECICCALRSLVSVYRARHCTTIIDWLCRANESTRGTTSILCVGWNFFSSCESIRHPRCRPKILSRPPARRFGSAEKRQCISAVVCGELMAAVHMRKLGFDVLDEGGRAWGSVDDGVVYRCVGRVLGILRQSAVRIQHPWSSF